MIATAPSATARHVDMPADEYHAHPAIGSSMLETFRASRREYHARYVAKAMTSEPSDAMQFGTLCHLLLLEPHRAAKEVAPPLPALGPDGKPWDRRTKAHKEAWQAELDARQGFPLVFSDDDLARAGRVVAAVKANHYARRLVDQIGAPEYSIFWQDSETGLGLKCRVDWWATIPIDIKTCRDASPAVFARQCVTLGYHRKRAHYVDGIRHLTGEKFPPMTLLAVESDGFHRVLVVEDLLDELDDGSRLGEVQRRSMLRELAACYESGDWSEPWEQTTIPLPLPKYAMFEDNYTYTR